MLPIFRSNFSLTSILTLDVAKENTEDSGGPDSIFQICKDNSMQESYIVDNTLTGLVDAYENAQKSGIKLRFGYRVNICQNISDLSPESENTTSKIIIFNLKNNFKDLIKLHNISSTKGLYRGTPRLDYDTLKDNWSDNLMLCIPFYDSYLHNNLLYGKQCVPELDFTTPHFFYEENGLPFDPLIKDHLFTSVDNKNISKCKTIYYNKKSDFKAYLTYRCILNRTTLQKPELSHFGSNEFCFESWLEQNK